MMSIAIRRSLLSLIGRTTVTAVATKSTDTYYGGSGRNLVVVEKKPSIVDRINKEFLRGHPISSPFTGSLLLDNSSAFLPNFTSRRFMLPFRRRKMNKHKRRKRFDRDYFIYQKYHAKKKAKAEAIFRQEMQLMMEELKAFDPLEYMKETIKTAKQEWNTSLSVSGRKKYPHWHQLMTLEELYGLSPESYIEKTVGRPSEEDEIKLKQLREDYFKNYIRKKSPQSPGQ